jgi:beta-lactam-binding protein with PASTA domain
MTMATGPVVPDVVGLSTKEAVAVLDHHSLPFDIRPVGGSRPVVVRQSPAPGGPVASGVIVVLEVSCFPAPCPSPLGGTIYDPCTCASR